MFRKFFLAISLGVATLGAVVVAHATFSGDPPVETFDGNPATPLPVARGLVDWDVQVHSRDPGTWFSLEPINAQHGADCSGPPSTHVNTSYDGAVFICRDHLMTSINASDYGMIYLTPNRMLDWSAGEAVLSFDMSTFKASGRDWVDIWLTPYASNIALPLDDWLPDVQGPPAGNFIHLRMDNFISGAGFRVYVNGNELGSEIGYDSVLTPDATRRDRFELRIGNGRISFGMPAYNLWWADNVAVNPGFTQGVVQLGHHSYTPTKDNSGVPGTWHWDNVSLSPAVPFSIQRANERYVDGFEGGAFGTVTFPPAPANAYLRFSALGGVKVNGQAVEPQPSAGTIRFEHFASYFVPIPQGSTSATIELGPRGWYDHDVFAKDFHVWSLSPSGATPTSTPSATSTSTAPATSTNTPQPTATNTPTATSTPSPSPTTTPPPTATPIDDRCSVRDWNEATARWREVTGTWVEAQPGLWACLVPRAGRVP